MKKPKTISELTSIINYSNLAKMGVADQMSDPISKRGLYLDIDNVDKPLFAKMKANLAKHKVGEAPHPFTDDEINKLKQAQLNDKIYALGNVEGGFYTNKRTTKFPPKFDHFTELQTFDTLKGAYAWINLIDNSKKTNLWQLKTGRMKKDYYQLISISTKNQHFYCCKLHLSVPFKLGFDQKAKYEPRNRIRTKGFLHFGKIVAKVIVQNRKEHYVYDFIEIREG
jgi:hypothetical protein